MTDWTEQGAAPVEDAAVDDPPTVDEVAEAQRRRAQDPDDEGVPPGADDHDHAP